MKKRDIILVIGGISFLILIIFLSLLLTGKFQMKNCPCPGVVSYNFIWVFIFLAVLFVGSLFYYLFSLKIDEKKKTIEKNIEVLYSILDKDEKNVLNKLINNQGKIEQSKISKDYDKIRAHRIIKKLKDKKIIDIIKKGKTNKIELKKELKRELVK